MSSSLTFRHSAFQGWIGVARRDVTPPVGVYSRCWGAATHDTAEGIHRPLSVTVLTISTSRDEAPHVLAAIDGGAWASPEAVELVRQEVSAAVGAAPEQVLLNLAHTHAGGPLFLGGDYRDFPGGDLAAEAFDHLRRQLREAAAESARNRVESVLSWDYGRCGLAANRELPAPHGERYVVSFNPAQPADDLLLVGRVTDLAGRLRATLVNYACHPTTMAWANRLISPDYVGALRETIESHTDGAPCAFLQGASGELSPRHDFSSDPAIADAQGRQVGFAALSVLAGMLPPKQQLQFARVVESGTPLGEWRLAPVEPSRVLASREGRVTVQLKPELRTTATIRQELAAGADRVMAERLRRQIQVRRWVGEEAATPFPVWTWRVGDAVLVGYPAEAYSDMQVHLRACFADRAVIVMNLVNGSPGYLPPADRYDLDIYSVNQTPFARGSMEQVRDAVERACRDLLAGSP